MYAENQFTNSKQVYVKVILSLCCEVCLHQHKLILSIKVLVYPVRDCLCLGDSKVKISLSAYVFVICVIWYSDSYTLSSQMFDSCRRNLE